MSSLKSIADAIAVQFTGVTANGETISVGPTASLPNVLAGPLVALLVYPPTGVLDAGVGRMRRDEYDFAVKLLRDPISVPERTDALYAWADATRDVVYGNLDLGFTYVSWARPIAIRVELDGETYNKTNVFDVVEITVRVHIEEVITTLAI
jgi:hypothetical protein